MNVKKLIIENTLDEGLGSVYERVMLGEFLENLIGEIIVSSILEYECPFTKGYDNLVFLKKGKDVSVYDRSLDLKNLWKFKEKPKFVPDLGSKKYNLVWNFAAAQITPEVINQMRKYSNKYVLVFTPNLFNYGAVFHFGYHLFANKVCTHAERGSRALRTILGLKNAMRKERIKPLKSGYIDIPWWPDTAASFAEVKRNVFKQSPAVDYNSKRSTDLRKAERCLELVDKWSFLERKPTFRPVSFVFAHHQFVFGEVE